VPSDKPPEHAVTLNRQHDQDIPADDPQNPKQQSAALQAQGRPLCHRFAACRFRPLGLTF
jgi:hypothetical protein